MILYMFIMTALWAVMVLSAAFGLLTGRVWGKGWRGKEMLIGRMIHRSDEPVMYWMTVLSYLAGAAILPAILYVGIASGDN